MAANQDEVDMESFQRLSDNYQPDVQVRSTIEFRNLLIELTFDRDLSFATDSPYRR